MNIGISIRIVIIIALIAALMLFAETKMDFIYAGF